MLNTFRTSVEYHFFSQKQCVMQTDTVKARFSIKNHASPAANKRRHEAFFKFYITL